MWSRKIENSGLLEFVGCFVLLQYSIDGTSVSPQSQVTLVTKERTKVRLQINHFWIFHPYNTTNDFLDVVKRKSMSKRFTCSYKNVSLLNEVPTNTIKQLQWSSPCFASIVVIKPHMNRKTEYCELQLVNRQQLHETHKCNLMRRTV